LHLLSPNNFPLIPQTAKLIVLKDKNSFCLEQSFTQRNFVVLWYVDQLGFEENISHLSRDLAKFHVQEYWIAQSKNGHTANSQKRKQNYPRIAYYFVRFCRLVFFFTANFIKQLQLS